MGRGSSREVSMDIPKAKIKYGKKKIFKKNLKMERTMNEKLMSGLLLVF